MASDAREGAVPPPGDARAGAKPLFLSPGTVFGSLRFRRRTWWFRRPFGSWQTLVLSRPSEHSAVGVRTLAQLFEAKPTGDPDHFNRLVAEWTRRPVHILCEHLKATLRGHRRSIRQRDRPVRLYHVLGDAACAGKDPVVLVGREVERDNQPPHDETSIHFQFKVAVDCPRFRGLWGSVARVEEEYA